MPASFTSTVGLFALLMATVLTGCSRDNPLSIPAKFVATDILDCTGLVPDDLILLKDIFISDSIISPKFDVDVLEYTANVDYLVDSILLSPFQVDPASDNSNGDVIRSVEIDVNGNLIRFGEMGAQILLTEGLNQIDMKVDAVIVATAPHEDCITLDDNGEVVEEVIDYSITYTLFVNRNAIPFSRKILELGSMDIDEGDLFGHSVAIDDDMLAVGAPHEDSNATGVYSSSTLLSRDNSASDSGAVYIYERDSSGNWNNTFYIKASNAEAGDLFGTSVSLQGDFLVVSALGEDSSSQGIDGREDSNLAPESGAVYLFKKNVDGWTQQHYIKPNQNVPGVDEFDDAFGFQVQIHDDNLLIAAPKEDSFAGGFSDASQANSGAVYLYLYDATSATWNYSTALKADIARANDLFGSSISMDEQTIAIGAPGENTDFSAVSNEKADISELEPGDPRLDQSKPDSGAVYLFDRIAGFLDQVAYVKASNVDSGDLFGSSVALSSGQLFVGATHEDGNGTLFNRNLDDNSLENSGAAYRYERVDNLWVGMDYIKSSKVQQGAEFGSSVAFDNNDLVVGAPFHVDTANNSLGLVHVYSVVDSVMNELDSLLGETMQVNEEFGGAISISNSTFAVGAKGHANSESGPVLENSGIVTVFQ